MLEVGFKDLYDQAYQEGFEIGMSEASLDMLTTMVGYAKIFMSEEKWERFKKSKEDKYRRHRKEYPENGDRYGRCYDGEGCLIKEKWIDEQKDIMSCMNFPEEGWEDLCAFVEKYPGLPPGVLARRILKESEYKYI